MKQIVCIKVTPKVDQITFDDEKKTVVRDGVENEMNEADKNALEMALGVKDSLGGTVTLLSMGPPSFEPFLKLGISMGADEAVLLSDRAFAGADTFATSLVLSKGISKLAPYDIAYCGEASSDGSTEQVPASVAEWLGIARVGYVNNLRVEGSKVIARRSIRGGHEILEADTPLLVSVELGCNTPRFPDFRRKRWAEKEFVLTTWSIQDLGLDSHDVGLEGSLTQVTGLSSMRVPERKRELIEGSDDEIVRRLVEVIRR